MPDTLPRIERPWSKSVEEVARELDVDVERGLSSDEAARRLEAVGPNWLREAPARSPWRILLSQFLDWMIGLLAVAAVVSAVIGEWHDSLLIAAIVLANAVIGFVQEWRAERAVAALKEYAQPKAKVCRDGQLTQLPAEQLVPGDVVELSAGALAPADVRVISVAELQADESPLTGESMSVDKQVAPVAPETGVPDRTSMVFAGTTVVRGHGRAVVTATGMDTELGKIATLLESAEAIATPLQQRLAALSKRLAFAVVVICIVVFIVGRLRSDAPLALMFLTSVSLAVAAIPEGLPAIITIALALGSQRMSRRKAIVRQLAAVETLGSVDVICTDKTGTLTQNKMKVSEVVPHREDDSLREELLRAALLCNDAEIDPKGRPIGSATEVALVVAATEAGLNPSKVRNEWPRQAEFPFTSDRKMMSTMHTTPSGKKIIYAKGAAEAILERSTHLADDADREIDFPPSDRQRLEKELEKLTGQGRRVLAVARREWSGNDRPQAADEAESKLAFIGFVGIIDPSRPEARQAIAECRSAGIKAVMITGDNQRTAISIAKDLDLWRDGDGVLSGDELEKLDDAALAEQAPRVAVYARVSPEHKLRIVKAHQGRGSVVSMTGDGVNDAPALKQADIGVAMGIAGTDVSKEAARMILADDNFATIVAAVEEGRVVYDNIRKSVVYLLTGNWCEILVIVVAIVLGWPLPLLPVHLLWVNLVTDGLPALALAFEPAEPGTMRRPPRKRDESIFAGGLARGIALVGLLMAGACLLMFWRSSTQELAYARTMVFVTLSFAQLFHVLALRSFGCSFFSQPPWQNWRLLAAVGLGAALQLAIVYVPILADWFHTVPLAPADLALAVAISTVGFLAVEAGKLFQKSPGRRR